MQVAETLSALALELGADVVGWANIAVPESSVAEYSGWLGGGLHAGMSYLERQLAARANPASRLSAVRSAMVIGISHAYEAPPRPEGGIRVGRVARYAWTPDYHEQIQPMLERFEAEACALGVRAKGYVDHGPVLERLFGAKAFLGWRAKSGMLVSTDLGAFFTLAVLLTDLEVDEPKPHPDRCGRCSRCVAACPTGAINSSRLIDSNRCISYLTIEHRGAVKRELKSSIGDWLFGCDICCEVCPWSEKAGKLASYFRPKADLAYPDLNNFFGLSEREFERRFVGTALLRPRRKGMARNALTVIGNTKDITAWPLLIQGKKDPAQEVREAAAWALACWESWADVEDMLQDPSEIVSATARAVLDRR